MMKKILFVLMLLMVLSSVGVHATDDFNQGKKTQPTLVPTTDRGAPQRPAQYFRFGDPHEDNQPSALKTQASLSNVECGCGTDLKWLLRLVTGIEHRVNRDFQKEAINTEVLPVAVTALGNPDGALHIAGEAADVVDPPLNPVVDVLTEGVDALDKLAHAKTKEAAADFGNVKEVAVHTKVVVNHTSGTAHKHTLITFFISSLVLFLASS